MASYKIYQVLLKTKVPITISKMDNTNKEKYNVLTRTLINDLSTKLLLNVLSKENIGKILKNPKYGGTPQKHQ